MLYDHDTMADANRRAGMHWFSRDTMRFFGTRFCGPVFQGPGGVFFVTSERDPRGARRYSVRRFDPETAGVDTVGEFHRLTSRSTALTLARRCAAGDKCAADELSAK